MEKAAVSSASATSWETLPTEMQVHIAGFLNAKDLQSLAASSLRCYALCHSRPVAEAMQARLRSRRITWSVSGPELARYALNVFRSFPHVSVTRCQKLLAQDFGAYAQGGRALVGRGDLHLRSCIQSRWIPTDAQLGDQGEGQNVLTRAVRADDLDSLSTLLSAGVAPHSIALNEAVRLQRVDHVKCLLAAGAAPGSDLIRAGYEQHDTDDGEMFVTLLREALISIDLGELDLNPDESVRCIRRRRHQEPATYWDLILKSGSFVSELEVLLEPRILTPPTSEDIEALSDHICEGTPLSPALYLSFTSGLSESVALDLARFFLKKGARVTPHVIEGALRTGSPLCMELILSQEGVTITAWMLERALVILSSQKELLKKLAAKCDHPSELAVELAIEHAPYLFNGLAGKLPVASEKKRLFAKAIYHPKIGKWPGSWRLSQELRLELLELACLWQPHNFSLIESLLQGLPAESNHFQRPFHRALRLGQAELIKRLLAHSPGLKANLRTILQGKCGSAVTATRTLADAGVNLTKQHLAQVFKQKPLNNELLLFLLEKGTPVAPGHLAIAARMGSAEVVAILRERGLRPTRRALERAFRRTPFDPAIIRELIKGEEAKWQNECKHLISYPLTKILKQKPNEVEPEEILKIASLFSTSNSQPAKAKRQKGKERIGTSSSSPKVRQSSRKGKEKTNSAPPTERPEPKVAAAGLLPELLIQCLFELVDHWPTEKVKTLFNHAAIRSDRRLFQYPARQSNLGLLGKLIDCGLEIDDEAYRFIMKQGLNRIPELLLNKRKFPSSHLVYELFQSPSSVSEQEIVSRLLAVSAISPHFQTDILYEAMEQASLQFLMPSAKTEERGESLRLIKRLVKQGVRPSVKNLELAAKLPLDIATSILEVLLSAWNQPLPASVVLNAARHQKEEARHLISYTLAQYSAGGGNREDLLAKAIGNGSRQMLQTLTRLLSQGVKPTESVLLQATTSSSEHALGFVEQLLKYEAVPTKRCFEAIADCRSPQAPQIATRLLAHPSRPNELSSNWISQLLANPSPAAGSLLKTVLEQGVTIKGLDEAALRQAVKSELDSAPEIVRVLLDHIPLRNALELAAANAAQGPKIVPILLLRGAKITESALWAAHCNREVHEIFYRHLTAQDDS